MDGNAAAHATWNKVVGWLLFVCLAVAIALSGQPLGVYGPTTRDDIREVDTQEARRMIDAGALVVDVREHAVAARAHLPNALLIPQEVLLARIGQVAPDVSRPVVVYCGDGSRLGPDATAALNQAGYRNAVNLRGGIEGWRAAGLPTASN
ncbi:MAG: rhodanese-like domain-containing protein [Burkholderiales bacterium]|nr:rhodanese-like domain-containing protein [Burkholderiales bacterium]